MHYTDMEQKLCQQLRERITDLRISDVFHVKDYNLIRFLRARDMNLDNAEDMFRKYIAWRSENNIDEALTWNIAMDLRENVRYKITGLNYKGGLVVCGNVGTGNPGAAYGRYDELMKVAFHELELLTQFLKALCTQTNRFERMVAIVNLEGLTLAHVTTADYIQAMVTLLKAYEAFFPETLEAAYVLNAPWVFSIAWAIAKPLISPNSMHRIKFLGYDKSTWAPEIMQVAAEDQFPETFGGLLPEDYELVLENGKIMTKYGDDETELHEYECPVTKNCTEVEELD